MFIYLRNVYVVFEHCGYESEFKVLIDNFQYLDEKSAPKFLEVDLENEGSTTFVVPYEEKLDKFYVEFKKVKATSFEFTYICLIALWSFHCLPEISESTKEIADKIIENASIKLHEYYTKELRMPDYAGRQAKLYKIAIMIESIIESKQEMLKAWSLFNFGKYAFSFPKIETDYFIYKN
uniref:NR LBD domain-containing protein n=1 Tax=Panagrolaimus davidi TaxID=227884 RepID=A0A914QSV9_9BILA